MASKDGKTSDRLALLDSVAAEPWRYGLLSLIRRLDSLNPDAPGTGRSVKPAQDAIRFSQDPFNEFAPSTLTGLVTDEEGRPPRLVQTFFGLFGPDGPLPNHLTEVARDRARQHADPTIARFADLFHHRLISLYYRAWAQAQPTVQFDRPTQDQFAGYVAALVGLRPASLRDADNMEFTAKLSFSGHLGSLPRNRTGLESLLSEYFQIPVQVHEFIAHWLRIPRRDHLLLGRKGGSGCLGQDTVIGERVWQRQDKIRVVLGPLSLDDYTAYLPTGKSFKALVSAVRNSIGMELLWEVNLVLRREEKPVTCLGKSGALGWTSWLQSERADKDVADLLLQVQNYVP